MTPGDDDEGLQAVVARRDREDAPGDVACIGGDRVLADDRMIERGEWSRPDEATLARDSARLQFEAAVAAHRPAMRALALRLCHARSDADDIIQDSLLRALCTKSKVSNPARMRAWLLTIVRNTFLDHLREERRQPQQVEFIADVAIPDPDEPARWEYVEMEHLQGAIARLPDDVRETYIMFTFDELDYIEIARRQQIAKATVGSRILRARKLLRSMLLHIDAVESKLLEPDVWRSVKVSVPRAAPVKWLLIAILLVVCVVIAVIVLTT